MKYRKSPHKRVLLNCFLHFPLILRKSAAGQAALFLYDRGHFGMLPVGNAR